MDRERRDPTAELAGRPDSEFVEAVAELRRIAAQLLADERPDHTLQPTALVNELYLRLVGRRLDGWESRAGFFAFAAKAMRWILIDHARRRGRTKRTLVDAEAPLFGPATASLSPEQLTDLGTALDELARIHERQARIVELHYFFGLSFPEIAKALDLSLATVNRDWAAARGWLYRALGAPGPGSSPSSDAQSVAGQSEPEER